VTLLLTFQRFLVGFSSGDCDGNDRVLIWWFFIHNLIGLAVWIGENQSVSGVITIFLTQCNTAPSFKVDQVVDCGLWNVGALLLIGCAKLLDIGRTWNTLLCRSRASQACNDNPITFERETAN